MRIIGEQATQVPGASNRFNIDGPQFSYFRTNGEKLIQIEAPRCVFDEADSRARTIYSEDELVMRTGDNRSSIQGRGFRWLQSSMTLIISNEVRALIQWTNNAPPLEITSRWFEFDANRNLGIFHEAVHGENSDLDFNCGELIVSASTRKGSSNALDTIEATGGLVINRKTGVGFARGDRGIYHQANEQIELIGAAEWKFDDYSGKADHMTAWMTTTNFDAVGNVRMSLPAKTLGAAGNLLGNTNGTARTTKTNLVTLSADRFSRQQDQLLADGKVRVSDGTNELTCDRLEGKLPTLLSPEEYAIATGHVFVGRSGGGIHADRADYSKTHDQVVFTGNPRFQQDQTTGTAERVVARPSTGEIQAEGGVNVKLTFAGSGDSFLNVLPSTAANRTATKSTTNQTVQVTADTFSLREQRAVFSGEVAAHQLPIDGSERRMSCGELEVRIASDRRHAESVQARQNVVCEQGRIGVTNGPSESIYSRMESQTLTAKLDPAQGELIDLIAAGGVRLTQPETTATGDMAKYLRATQQLQLVGPSVIDNRVGIWKSSRGLTWDIEKNVVSGSYDSFKSKPAAFTPEVLNQLGESPKLRTNE